MNVSWLEYNYKDAMVDDGCCHSTWTDSIGDVSTELFDAEDIEEILGEGGRADEWWSCDWVYGKLKDGRYFYFMYDADITFSGANMTFASSREEIERFGLGAEQRKELGIVLSDLE